METVAKLLDLLSVDAKSLPRGNTERGHDKVALRVHWEICRKYGIECTDKWYDHQPLAVTENKEVRITWDITVYTDKKLNHNRPDITLVQKNTQKWTLIDIAVPADQNIINTEEEKVDRYQDLAFEIKRIHRASKSDSDTNCHWQTWNNIKECKVLA